MNLSKPIQLILASIALCVSIPLAAGAQVVQLTHDPEEIYLPQEIQIQDAVRLEDGRVLVVWGTTEVDSSGLNYQFRLVYQFADSSAASGAPLFLTSYESRPEKSITLIRADSDCLAFWSDGRDGSSGTYVRHISYDGGELSSEVKIDSVYFSLAEKLQCSEPDQICVLVSSGKRAQILTFDGMETIPRSSLFIEQPVTQVLEVNRGPYAQVLILADGRGIPVPDTGVIDPLLRIPAERILNPMQIDADGSVWVQEDSLLLGFANWWNESPDTVIRLPRGLSDGILFAQMDSGRLSLHGVTTWYDTLWYDGYEWERWMHLVVVTGPVGPDMSMSVVDTLPITTLDASRIYNSSNAHQNELWIARIRSAEGIAFPPRIVVEVEGILNGRPNTIRFKRDFVIELDLYGSGVSVVPEVEEHDTAPLLHRISDPYYSNVQLKADGVKLHFRASAAKFKPHVPVHYLALVSRNDKPVVYASHARSDVVDGKFCPGESISIDPKSLGVQRIEYGRCLQFSIPEHDPGWEAGDLAWTNTVFRYNIQTVGNFVVASTRSWRNDHFQHDLYGTPYPIWYSMAHHAGVSGDFEFVALPPPMKAEPRAWHFYDPIQYRPVVGAWDPNSGGLYLLADVLRDGLERDAQMYARILPNGTIAEVREIPFTDTCSHIIPVSVDRFLYLNNMELRAFPDARLVSRFARPLKGEVVQRLHGDYFLRSGEDSAGYRLEVYDLSGDSVVTGDLPELNSRAIVDPAVKRIVVISLVNNTVRLRAYNQRLQPSADSIREISIDPELIVKDPVGTVIGDSIYIAWIGTNVGSGRQEAYLARSVLPDVPDFEDSSGLADTGTTEEDEVGEPVPGPNGRGSDSGRLVPIPYLSRYADGVPLSLYPNPTTGELHVPIRLGVGWPVTIAMVDELGRVVHREEFQGRVGENHFLVDLSRLQSGAYVVRLTAGEGEGIGRVWVNAIQ